MRRRSLLPIAVSATLVAAGAAVVVAPPPALAEPGPALEVDVAADRHPISPHIYGMNFADEALAAELALPVRRWGGNATTRYHYRYDTTNRASDWFFENIAEENADPEALPDGSSTDRFVEQDRRTGTDSVLTVPLIGWAPKARDGSCGFSVAKYGPQERTDEWRPDCGNGVRPDGSLVTGNDPHDTSVQVGPEYVRDWLRHLTAKYGTAAEGGVKFYNLDNEPDIWHSTHRDVHPTGANSAELRDQAYAIGAAVKEVDPSAATLGPVGWGWTSWDYSGLDQEVCGRTGCWADPPDRPARDGLPFATWYLQQMRDYEERHGQRVLDYFDMHFYPQAAGVAFGNGNDPATNALRLRSTRALWDPTYTDESWINTPVRLVPRMKELVAANYPGTRTAVTEYNWGALDHVNGALAQADVLGIFGREGLDLATLWAPPAATQPGAYAFRMYRNYDGAGGRFGDLGVRATSADSEQLSVYAAERGSDGALTVMVVNKSGVERSSSLSLRGRTAPSTQVYRYGAGNLGAIVREADQRILVPPPVAGAPNGILSHTFPADSVTLFVIGAPSTPPPLTVRHRNLDRSFTNARIHPAIELDNPGSVPVDLSRVTVRYWFTRDGGRGAVQAACVRATTGCANLTQWLVALPRPRRGADGYLEVGFTRGAGTLPAAGQSGPIEVRLTKADGSRFVETDDHSWRPAAPGYAASTRITVYLDGLRIAGTEP
ncbi:glycoside hydrolase family 44 protein [Plantactinospora sp. DSM 117369]